MNFVTFYMVSHISISISHIHNVYTLVVDVILLFDICDDILGYSNGSKFWYVRWIKDENLKAYSYFDV